MHRKGPKACTVYETKVICKKEERGARLLQDLKALTVDFERRPDAIEIELVQRIFYTDTDTCIEPQIIDLRDVSSKICLESFYFLLRRNIYPFDDLKYLHILEFVRGCATYANHPVTAFMQLTAQLQANAPFGQIVSIWLMHIFRRIWILTCWLQQPSS